MPSASTASVDSGLWPRASCAQLLSPRQETRNTETKERGRLSLSKVTAGKSRRAMDIYNVRGQTTLSPPWLSVQGDLLYGPQSTPRAATPSIHPIGYFSAPSGAHPCGCVNPLETRSNASLDSSLPPQKSGVRTATIRTLDKDY